jgi:AAA+ superfamily predicted ATPase
MQTKHIKHLSIALDWLTDVAQQYLECHFGRNEHVLIQTLDFPHEDSPFIDFIKQHQLNIDELLILMLVLAPHLKPNFFISLIATYLPDGGDFPEFGGVRGTHHRDILPTGETAQFILAGYDIEKRLYLQNLLMHDSVLVRKQMLSIEPVREGEPVMSGRLLLDPELIELLTVGSVSKPRFSMDFPAEHLQTEMDWDDLVLAPNTQRQIAEILNWIKFNHTLLHDWGMNKKVKPGYRALFYGPPGTGKTVTASLLGKATGLSVFRIDLSRMISKYIGETEKNLSKLFDKAENKNWILFFDEAEALFSKRTDIRDAHDKYANQEVAYLLQRIESYNGLVILATNQRSNIDDAFVRRFQTIIHFAMPSAEERYLMWKQAFPTQVTIAEDVCLENISNRFELSGSTIVNIVHYCCIELLANNKLSLELVDLERAIMRELLKEGKVV